MAQKSVLITGCSEGGIGDALAQAFHRRGLCVFATARNPAKAEHLKARGMDVLPLDVTSPSSLEAAVETVKAATGGTLDFLVNNSGAGYSAPLLDADIEQVKKMFDVNVFGIVATIQAFAPLLIAAKGTILNIGSIAGYGPFPWQSLYNASKGAVHQLTDTLRLELDPFDVKVILVVSGGVKTKFFGNQTFPRLPSSSLYSPIKDIVDSFGSGDAVLPSFVERQPFAESVVRNALSDSPKTHHWLGESALVTWVVHTFAWHGFWDWIIPSHFGIPVLKKKLRAQKQV